MQSVTFSTISRGTAARSISIVASDGWLEAVAAAESVEIAFARADRYDLRQHRHHTGRRLGRDRSDSGVTVSFLSQADLTGLSMRSASFSRAIPSNYTPTNGISDRQLTPMVCSRSDWQRYAGRNPKQPCSRSHSPLPVSTPSTRSLDVVACRQPDSLTTSTAARSRRSSWHPPPRPVGAAFVHGYGRRRRESRCRV